MRTCRHPGDPWKTGSYSWRVGSEESWRRLKPKLFGTRMRRGCTGALTDAANHRTEQQLIPSNFLSRAQIQQRASRRASRSSRLFDTFGCYVYATSKRDTQTYSEHLLPCLGGNGVGERHTSQGLESCFTARDARFGCSSVF
jgi:hypothetical protein